jgi:Xaa-Pro dipeptidase
VFDALRPGISWLDMHLLSEKIMLEGLCELGLITGDIEEMLKGRVGFIF